MPKTILIVEDDPDIRELLSFTLSRSGFEPLEAISAEHALGILADNNPLAAVVDWMLQGMDGIDLAYRLRRDEFTQAMPIILLTARGEESDKLRSFESGVDDYITKPFSPQELIARLKAVLRRSGTATHTTLELGAIRMDLDKHLVTVNGHDEHLGPAEYRLLEFLMHNPE